MQLMVLMMMVTPPEVWGAGRGSPTAAVSVVSVDVSVVFDKGLRLCGRTVTSHVHVTRSDPSRTEVPPGLLNHFLTLIHLLFSLFVRKHRF